MPGRGTFKEDNKVTSSLVGLVAVRDKNISVIPLQSKYIPKRGDVVIGEITDIRFSMWNLDINSPYSGFLPASDVFGKEKRDLSKAFNVGDVLFLRVVDVDEVKKVKLGLKGRGLGKFRGGILINITPTKVPRLIGKKGIMINMIKDETKCEVTVGQNGVVWVKGKPDMERVAEKVINMIEEQAHTSGLTDRVRNMLLELLGKEKPLEKQYEARETEESKKQKLKNQKDQKKQKLKNQKDQKKQKLMEQRNQKKQKPMKQKKEEDGEELIQ